MVAVPGLIVSINSVVYFISFIWCRLIVYCLFGCVLDLLLFVFMVWFSSLFVWYCVVFVVCCCDWFGVLRLV